MCDVRESFNAAADDVRRDYICQASLKVFIFNIYFFIIC